MRIYIAASYPRKDEAIRLSTALSNKKNNIVSSWLFANEEGYSINENKEDKIKRMRKCAIRDLKEIKYCDMLVCFTGDNLTHGGRHTELGAALALGKRVVIIGKEESVFHYHPYVIAYKTIEEFLK